MLQRCDASGSGGRWVCGGGVAQERLHGHIMHHQSEEEKRNSVLIVLIVLFLSLIVLTSAGGLPNKGRTIVLTDEAFKVNIDLK